MEPLSPRITKSTAVATIKALFPKDSDLLKRFEIAKQQANIWDGERDGIREVVKLMPSGQYDNVILEQTSTAAVLYPNSDGKHQLENCLQTTIPAPTATPPGAGIIVFTTEYNVEQFLDEILHKMQTSKQTALEYLQSNCIGTGDVVENTDLYAKTEGSKAKIVILPE